MSEFNKCRREGRITWGDDFNSLAEVVGLFGIEDPKVLGDTSFPVPGKENMLCCFVSEKCSGGWEYKRELGPQCDARGWNETLRYAETNMSIGKQKELITSELSTPKIRLVFWRERREGQNWYKFAGVFLLNRVRTENNQFDDDNWCWYYRVDTVVECPKADWRVTTFGINEQYCWDARLHGELVKCELMDDIESEDRDGKCLGERIWPGTILRVVHNGVGPKLRCMIKSEGRDFLIPRRDFELGYFRMLGGKLGETKLVKNAAQELNARRVVVDPAMEKLERRLERKLAEYERILSKPDTRAHKRLVETILQENNESVWAFAYWDVDAGRVEFKDIHRGFLEAHAIGGSVGYHGLGHFALFDSDGNYVKLVD